MVEISGEGELPARGLGTRAPIDAVTARRRDAVRTVAIAAAGLAVLGLLWLLFFWRVLTPTDADRVIFDQTGDFFLHFFAPIQYQVERLASGQLPLWNPYNYGGIPSAADIQNGLFYLPRYLGVLLVGAENWTFYSYQVEIAAHYWLASALMFAYLWMLLRRPLPALIGGVLFAYSGYMVGYPMLQGSTVETEAWLPLALLGVHLSLTRSRWRLGGGLLAALAVGLMLVAGRPQAALYLLYVVAGYALVVAWTVYRDTPRAGVGAVLWRFALIFGLGGALAAAQLLPMAELARESFRVVDYSFEDKAGGFAPAELTRLLWPGAFGTWSPLYAGVAGLLLALGSLMRPRSLLENFWLGVFVLALVLSLGNNSAAFDAFYVFAPGFSLFRNQERLASLVTLALAILAACQIAQISRLTDSATPDARRLAWLAYGYAAFLGLAFLVTVILRLAQPEPSAQMVETADVFGYTALVGGAFALWMVWQRQPTAPRGAALGLLAALIVFDLFSVGMESINFVPDRPENRMSPPEALRDFAVPEGDIQWRVDGAAGLQGRGTAFRIPDIYGLGPISLDIPERLYSIPVDRLWEIMAVRYVTAIDPPPDPAAVALLAYGTNYDGQPFELLEIRDPRPMAHLVYDYRQSEGSREFARQIMSDPRVDLREMAVTTFPLPEPLPVNRPEVSAVRDFRMVTPERIEMRVDSGANALLTVAVINYPGWRATVNEQPVQIAETYAGLIGIPVPAGEDQRVVLQFVSDSLNMGMTISLIALVMLLAGAVIAGVTAQRQAVPTEVKHDA